MKVQTTYNGKILREGKEYEIPMETAKRWDVSNIAEIIINQNESNEG